MVQSWIPPPQRPTRSEAAAGRSAEYFKAARQRQAAEAAQNEALMHFKQLHLDRLKRVSDAAEAAARAATNAYLDMLLHDKPRPPRFTYKFWSVTVSFALIWGVLGGLAYWWFFKR